MKIKPAERFYDTSSLLILGDSIFDSKENFFISSVTLQELENIKTSSRKDDTTKFMARELVRLLTEHVNEYTVVLHKKEYEQYIIDKDLDVSFDTKILADAYWVHNNIEIDNLIFVTNDLSLYNLANLFFGNDSIEIAEAPQNNYTGYKKITLSDDEINKFYTNGNIKVDCLKNQYLLIYNNSGEYINVGYYDGQKIQPLKFNVFESRHFGTVKPIKNDIYQKMAADSLSRNKITLVKGKSGSGKTYLSLAYLFSALEAGRIDRIVVFCNTVATRNSAKLGFYPGSRIEKLLDSQIGNLLASKLGGRIAVEQLIQQEQLILLPMSDIRGYDTSGMKAGVYITEAQNLDITLIKLALQRIGEDSICIIDGDEETQVDDVHFEGANNGMKRVSKVFRGSDIYGEIKLEQIHRSQIATIADKL